MKIPEIISDHAKKIALGALVAAIGSILAYFGYVKPEENAGGGVGTQITDNQTIGDNSDCNTQTDGSGNTVTSNCETNNNTTNNVENIDEKTEIDKVDQYIKDGGDGGNTFCAGNDDTACSNDDTINNNPAQ